MANCLCLIQYPVTPWGLQEELNKFKLLYGNPPIFIYENGISLSLFTMIVFEEKKTSLVVLMVEYKTKQLDSTRHLFCLSIMMILAHNPLPTSSIYEANSIISLWHIVGIFYFPIYEHLQFCGVQD